jgi:penicillin amidase
MRRILIVLGGALAVVTLCVLGFVAYVFDGVHSGAQTAAGTRTGFDLRAPVQIDRDARGIPHIRAQNERDVFFAEGYVQGSDRLFQIDIYRRAVTGRLAEVFGSVALPADEEARIFDVASVIAQEEASLKPREREDLDAFAAGVNAAIRTRPLPPEFRAFGYRPEPWTGRDSLFASFSTVLALADTWDDVATRADIATALGERGLDAFYPITDPLFDAPTTSPAHAPVAPLPALLSSAMLPETRDTIALEEAPDRRGVGSNDFAAGAALTATHRALLANDPHLALRIPGVWYLADLKAPGFHAAGATLAGVPGIILGHNEHLAWGATNGTIASTALFRERFRSVDSDQYLADGRWMRATHRTETFNVRFGKSVTRDYLATRHGFLMTANGVDRYAVAWTGERDRRAGFDTFSGLERAGSIAEAMQSLAKYPGPTQNFVLADDAGNAAYAMAGDVWLDDAWGRFALDGTKRAVAQRSVPFAQLPRVRAARNALVFSANNRVYGAGYPYLLSAGFAPPYRAARIAAMLRTGKRPYDVAAFSAIQADVTSIGERELARATVAALQRTGVRNNPDLARLAATLKDFDGQFSEGSKAAVYASALRIAASNRIVRAHLAPDLAARYLDGNSGTALVIVLRIVREHPRGWVPGDDYDAFLAGCATDAMAVLRQNGRLDKTWGEVAARIAKHPISSFGFTGWNGARFPGHGDAFSPHVQGGSVSQSFRAVWDIGNWDAGGVVIPLGESGQPGSVHYLDGAPVWLSQALVSLPFSDAAVAKAKIESLELRP